MKILAAVTPETGAPFVVEEVELTENLGPHEVLVKNIASGICHTDIALGQVPNDTQIIPGIDFVPKPIIFGHEGAGVVEKIGSAVTDLAVGDHVIMSFESCHECPACDINKNSYCPDFIPLNLSGERVGGGSTVQSEKYPNLKASVHQQSSFSTYCIATDKNTVKVPKEAPLEILGPIGCGFLTGAGAVINRLKPRPGSSFAAFGCGPLGFAAMFMAKKAGCEQIIAVDLHDSRLELAKAFGATHTVNASECDSKQAVVELTGMGVDYAFEATGSVKVMSQMIAALGPFGHAVVAGVVPDENVTAEFSPAWMEVFGKTVSGIQMGDGDMRGVITQMVDAVMLGEFPMEKIAKFYDFHDINQAVEDSKNGNTIKAILRMPH